MPGDDEIKDPTYLTTRAVTINASSEKIWPWLPWIESEGRGFKSLRAYQTFSYKTRSYCSLFTVLVKICLRNHIMMTFRVIFGVCGRPYVPAS